MSVLSVALPNASANAREFKAWGARSEHQDDVVALYASVGAYDGSSDLGADRNPYKGAFGMAPEHREEAVASTAVLIPWITVVPGTPEALAALVAAELKCTVTSGSDRTDVYQLHAVGLIHVGASLIALMVTIYKLSAVSIHKHDLLIFRADLVAMAGGDPVGVSIIGGCKRCDIEDTKAMGIRVLHIIPASGGPITAYTDIPNLGPRPHLLGARHA